MTNEAAIIAIVTEMYSMISGPPGARDWSRQAALFHPQARQMRTGLDAAGAPFINIMSADEYRENVAPFFAANPFYEIETARRIDILGNIAHVWSAYEARTSPDAKDVERRGVNSIQLTKDEAGWRIISMIWDNEREGVQIAPF